MMTLLSVLVGIVAVFGAYTLAAPILLNRGRYNKGFRVMCPERNLFARVEANANAAAIAAAYGAKRLPVRRCDLLKTGETCDGACLRTA
jgi:hypothetical protein